jgi:hypothetical protein
MPETNDQSDSDVQLPGGPAPAIAEGSESPEMIALRAQNAQLQALVAEQQAALAEGRKVVASAVTEPITPHGREKLALSAFSSMTVRQAQKAHAEGSLDFRGQPSVLCSDGYFCDPGYR